uniref:Uncharacterized protein n=1 Tax=Fagus sylvatica TaxID=28930 RepID=A0A2N9H8Y9_FAGSY
MPMTKLIHVVCAFLLVLILYHEIVILNVEGRQLKSDQACNKCSMHVVVNTWTEAKVDHDHQTTTVSLQSEQKSKMEYVNDFRPTEPGHSPGVGHSVNN